MTAGDGKTRGKALVVPFPLRPWKGRGEAGAEGVGRFGIIVLLVSLFMLFGALFIAVVSVRLRAGEWPPPGLPELPAVLWFSTALLIGVSVFLHRAWRHVRRNEQRRFRRKLTLAATLATGFLIAQAAAWFEMARAGVSLGSELYGFVFYTMTGLHAAHVFGGLIPLLFVTRWAQQGRYDAARHAGVEYIAYYWHFLDAVWLVVFGTLAIG